MANIGIIRCEKNEGHCPLTGCLKCLSGTREGFASYNNAEIVGIFTCRCPGDNVGAMGKILKNKGAEVIHFCTCTFAHKEDGQWVEGEGFCPHLDKVLERLTREADIPCVKGTAHLPVGYALEVFK